MQVEIFVPCFIDQLYPQTAFNMIKVLERAGCGVHYNTNQTCCGQPAFNAGFANEAREVGTKFINDFEGTDCIVGPSASCVGFVRNYYPGLFENGTLHNRVKGLGKRMYEFSEFLIDVLKVENFNATLNAKATYHDSCSGLREIKIKSGPRKLLSHVKGLELIEMNDTETCCGFGGTFSVKYEPISLAMADQKVKNAMATGAEYIISTDMSCLMQIQGYINKNHYNLKTLHLADVLASGWE
ncbi:MAG: (Fe-S)-binding protein [Chitinophagaceae bacterium]|nr:(Fe-S)-binding protein [Bacteroidota bacterium]MCC6257675.1 (Fe-S)-binding protein [Chitinophagaceae bacterium]MCW5916660.1 (Fe-S)-binding protein [Ferruginibacter sp.]